eukprot:5012832-Pyramimonas_sp.AAC.1
MPVTRSGATRRTAPPATSAGPPHPSTGPERTRQDARGPGARFQGGEPHLARREQSQPEPRRGGLPQRSGQEHLDGGRGGHDDARNWRHGRARVYGRRDAAQPGEAQAVGAALAPSA